jgi:hypothetical protein
MGRTLPTLSQSLTESEAQLARFRRGLRRSDQYIFDGLFAAARRHVTAISQAEALLPFEAALLAMLLEQAREIALLQHEVDLLRQNSAGARKFFTTENTESTESQS